MKFLIVEFDKDYHTVTNQKFMEFETRKQADEYCEAKSWTGEYYFVSSRGETTNE